MANEFNEEKIRKYLLILYQKFIDNPEDEEVRSDLIKFDREFGGLTVYNKILKSQPIPKYISNAIGHVSTIFQYGFGIYEDNWILEIAKETLKNLEKAKKS